MTGGVKPDFKKMSGLVPAIIQDARTKDVLMLGFMNEAALDASLRKGQAVFWSRSKGRLWRKGEESGNTLEIVDVRTDCDNDTLLVSVNPAGPVCHTGARSCFETIDKG